MPTPITRDKVENTMREPGATIVDVLDSDQYDDFHLPGAVNVPMGEAFDDRIEAAVPSKNEKVVVYCKDKQCPASAKAAARMEAIGYREVYDYEGGKMDWKQAGLPITN